MLGNLLRLKWLFERRVNVGVWHRVRRGVDHLHQSSCHGLSLCYGTTLCSGSQFYQIPATTADNLTIKQAVVTTISGLCVGESSSLMFPQITSTAGGFVFLPLSPAGQNESASTVSTKMYFPPQSYIEFNLNNNYGGGSPACSLSVMGYYLTH
jgi:hypothetical protein